MLEGAKALALPINKGQSLEVSESKMKGVLQWHSQHLGGNWFNAELSIPQLEIIETDNVKIAKRLVAILKKTKEFQSEFLNGEVGLKVKTKLEFLPWHGLGSSSTLINNIAKWAGVDAFELQKSSFGGSGYDIACANSNSPLFFELKYSEPLIEETTFNLEFSDNIYFVYLGKKQKSIESIKSFRKNAKFTSNEIDEISKISRAISNCKKLEEFEYLVETHEDIISKVLVRPTIKSIAFSDFSGSVKSLGGWGGDFVMMTTKMNKMELAKYLLSKNLDTFFPFNDLLIK